MNVKVDLMILSDLHLTGFIGKVLIHKLLMACPGICKIYLLIRPKRGQEPNERLKSLLALPVFAAVPEEKLAKLCVLEGDITLPKLGLSELDEHLLAREVSVIFHSAATVKFDEDLSKSLIMNVQVQIFGCHYHTCLLVVKMEYFFWCNL